MIVKKRNFSRPMNIKRLWTFADQFKEKFVQKWKKYTSNRTLLGVNQQQVLNHYDRLAWVIAPKLPFWVILKFMLVSAEIWKIWKGNGEWIFRCSRSYGVTDTELNPWDSEILDWFPAGSVLPHERASLALVGHPSSYGASIKLHIHQSCTYL